jgi:hypothetical protein
MNAAGANRHAKGAEFDEAHKRAGFDSGSRHQ